MLASQATGCRDEGPRALRAGAAVKDRLASLRGRTNDLPSRRLRATRVGMGDRATEGRHSEGITVRHGKCCPTREGGPCRCCPAYQAQVFSPRDRRTIRKSFRTLADARLALRHEGRPPPGHHARPDPHNPRRGRRGLARGRQGGHSENALGRPLHALGAAQLRGGAQDQGPARARPPTRVRGRPGLCPGHQSIASSRRASPRAPSATQSCRCGRSFAARSRAPRSRRIRRSGFPFPRSEETETASPAPRRRGR